MKCDYKRSYYEARKREYEKQQREYDEWFNNLSKEEQEAERKHKENNLKLVRNMLTICNDLNIDKYY